MYHVTMLKLNYNAPATKWEREMIEKLVSIRAQYVTWGKYQTGVCQTDGFQGTACDEYVNLNLEKDSA